jgi:hypothetical protein
MNNSFKLILFVFLVLIFQNCANGKGVVDENSNFKVVSFTPNKESLIRNPGMGWTLYDDANDEVANAVTYWQSQDEVARKYASCFYIRWRWSDMEPEEGKYAWEYNENFKALVKGALNRGLKLAFRIYVDGQDNIRPGTPQFVFDAGAESYEVSGFNVKHPSPYLDDPIFQKKFSNFIQAFSKKFDDPSTVDFVDGFNLGWWGEGHHLKFKNASNKTNTFQWIINLYGSNFKDVPLVMTINSEIGYETEKSISFDGQGYHPRRDGFSSEWFTDYEKGLLVTIFPNKMVVAESCYWGGGDISYSSNLDPKYNWTSWGAYYTQVVSEALFYHANYLDLREAAESKLYMTQAEDQIKKFMIQGGYRLYPKEITYSETISSKQKIEVKHSWANLGEGYLPNNDKRWNYKYKVAFSLLDYDNKVIKQWISANAEPSAWVKSKDSTYSESLNIENVPVGNYKLALAIVDITTESKPAINLAVDKNLLTSDNWLKVGDVRIK